MMNSLKWDAKWLGLMMGAGLIGPLGVPLAPVQARVLLKPNGSNALPLRTKAIEAEVQIEGQFATTQTRLTFQNEASQQIEADFLYTVPDGTVVTYFAYWYQGEKVVARIVEKERAAAIYKHITSRMRDPALVEMIGKNTFRARIFPIEANADLRVEMHFAQALPASVEGATYRFPLAPEEAGKGTLDKLDVRLHVAPGAGFNRLSNNYKQPSRRDAGGWNTRLSQLNFRPDKDWLVHLHRAPRPLHSALIAAPSGGRDGFFALALTPSRTLSKPRWSVSGVRLYDVLPAPPVWKAGQSVVLLGRYRGSGTANLQVAGVPGTSRLIFGSTPRDNNVATKLWAAGRIAALGKAPRGRSQVIALSKRFTLPSTWTSWLAVPAAELVRFKREKTQAELSIIGRRYALEIAAGRGQGRAARALKAQFNVMAQEIGGGDGDLKTYIATTQRELSRQLSDEKFAARPNARRIAQLKGQVNRLKRVVASEGEGREPIYIIEEDLRAGSRALLDEESAARGQGRRARMLRQELRDVARRASNYGWTWDTFYGEQKEMRANSLAAVYTQAKFGARDESAARRAQKQLEALLGAGAGARLASERRQWADAKLQSAATRLVDVKNSDTPDAREVQRWQSEIDRLVKLSGVPATDYITSAQSQWAGNRLNTLADQLVQANYGIEPDEKQAARLEAEIERVQKRSGIKVEEQWAFSLRLEQALNEARSTYLAERQEARPNRQRLQRDEKRMARIFADPRYVGRLGVPFDRTQNPLQHPKLAQLRSDLNDLDARLAAHPDAQQSAQIEAQRNAKLTKLAYATRYFLRLGDPLISIDAPADCAQVVAVMPDGQVKKLKWNATNKRWEARFDIPSYASEGAYVITVVVVDKAGARRSMDIKYRVDMTQPSGAGQAQMLTPSKDEPIKLRLEVSAEAGTTRVFALLPWGDKIDLKPAGGDEHRFFALATLPRGQKSAPQVTYVLTDKAHNRTSITVDVTR